ncbi:MAG: peptidylprolyl isomerase [Zetaproteobacteria bacterium]|nr:peptidylprolyl isomerase [Zetaproteobacteria bacterium]
MSDMKTNVEAACADIDFENKKYTIEMDTNYGPIHLELFGDVAPGHCKNIIGLARNQFFDGLGFHRIIPDFVIQGGCPEGNGTGGPGYNVPAEFNELPHEEGVLSMARAQDPDSAGSQFFICLGKVPYLDRQYTVFGKATGEQSFETIRKIGAVRTEVGDKPVEAVTMQKVIVTEA